MSDHKRRPPRKHRGLMLRTCGADMSSHGGFVWPESGFVEAPDWDPAPRCGGGLHGCLWGEGDPTAVWYWGDDARWLVCEVDLRDVVDLGGKVKVPRAWVVYCGDRDGATRYLLDRAPGRAVIGAAVTAGNYGTATAGYGGTSTAGDYGTATAGDYGTATAGDYGTATAGHGSTATAGDYGTATAGDRGTATAGYGGTATAGDRGTACAGVGGEVRIRWHDGKRYRLVVGYVGEEGIEPDRPYRCDAEGRLVVASEGSDGVQADHP